MKAIQITTFLVFLGCGAPESTKQSELAYLLDQKGRFVKRDHVIDSQPLQNRLRAVLQSRYETFLKNWDAEGPVAPNDQSLRATGCVSHFCDQRASAFHIDLRKDELIALLRSKDSVEVFREGKEGLADLPDEARDWIGKSRIAVGTTEPLPSEPESTGAFAWKKWSDAPNDWMKALKRIKANKKISVFEQAKQAVDMNCDVRIAQYDLDGNGKPGTLLTYQCEFWCGQVGCAFQTYEGGKRISLTDIVEQVRSGHGGVISSKGVLLKLK